MAHAVRYGNGPLDLERIRRDGYALSLEDMTIGVGAVGAPVFDRSGAAIASISAAGLDRPLHPPAHEDIAIGVVRACESLSRRRPALTGARLWQLEDPAALDKRRMSGLEPSSKYAALSEGLIQRVRRRPTPDPAGRS